MTKNCYLLESQPGQKCCFVKFIRSRSLSLWRAKLLPLLEVLDCFLTASAECYNVFPSAASTALSHTFARPLRPHRLFHFPLPPFVTSTKLLPGLFDLRNRIQHIVRAILSRRCWLNLARFEPIGVASTKQQQQEDERDRLWICDLISEQGNAFIYFLFIACSTQSHGLAKNVLFCTCFCLIFEAIKGSFIGNTAPKKYITRILCDDAICHDSVFLSVFLVTMERLMPSSLIIN